jgi:hypothetical protein
MNWQINFRLLDPCIHPEDAMAAVHAKLAGLRKRRKVSEQIILEDLLIASLVEQLPKDKNFWERLARAIATDEQNQFRQRRKFSSTRHRNFPKRRSLNTILLATFVRWETSRARKAI